MKQLLLTLVFAACTEQPDEIFSCRGEGTCDGKLTVALEYWEMYGPTEDAEKTWVDGCFMLHTEDCATVLVCTATCSLAYGQRPESPSKGPAGESDAAASVE